MEDGYPCDLAHDIGDGVRASEGRAAPAGHVELAEAVEEIAAADLAHVGADAVVGPHQWSPRPQTPIQGHLGLADREEHP